jgi:hypothetical protein
MRHTTLLALPFAIGLFIGIPSASLADPGPDNFGQHVSTCAQTMEFGADHNPGMHQGASGWDGTPC